MILLFMHLLRLSYCISKAIGIILRLPFFEMKVVNDLEIRQLKDATK